MWLMSSRTRKQQRAAADFRSHLAPGQEVMTGSGMFGTVVAVDDDVITIESTPGSQTRWLRAAIAKVIEPPVDADEDDADKDDAADDDVDGADDTVVDVPDDLSSLPPARGDEDPEKK
ncbi:preprotein translocase subunit YajC [Cellulomonas sp. WB94]|nr:preprotein translocase subunit YajC [Cellulomonas sp. WB94]